MDENQKRAVENIEGPLLVTAGPGSGKTRTLVNRTIHMIRDLGIPEREILLATFTERAARELITRLKDIDIKDMYIGTIHSICRRILEENIDRTSLRRGYTILDPVDQKFFIYRNMKYFRALPGYETFMRNHGFGKAWYEAGKILGWVSIAGEAKGDLKDSKDQDLQFVGEIYGEYQKLLERDNLLDFTRIQQELYHLLLENPDVLERIRDRIRYLMIDEYQDTNRLQAEIMLLIAGERENICVVGDDDQGLYRFRGAVVENILNFQNEVKKPCQVITLDTNYRSHENIVKFSNEWIRRLNWDGFRMEKEMKPFRRKQDNGHKVIKVTAPGNYDRWNQEIFAFLRALKDNEKIEDYSQVAFLFRSVRNYKVRGLAEYLKREGIPVYSPRSNLFFEREEIRLFIGLLVKLFRVDLGIDDDYYMQARYLLEKKLGEEKDSFTEWCEKERGRISFLEIFYEALSFDFLKVHFHEGEQGIMENRGAYNLGKMSELMGKMDLFVGMGEKRDEELEKAVSYIFRSHLKFLIGSTIDEYEDMREYAPRGAVSFLTFHQSKGLELPVVVVGSMEGKPGDSEGDEWDKSLKQKILGMGSREPSYRMDEFDFWRAYYTAFSRAQDLLVLTGIENRKAKNPSPSVALAPLYDRLQEWRDAKLWDTKESFQMTKAIDIKEMFSFTSHILSYERCPRRYRFFKEFKMEEIKREEAFFGTLLHSMIEGINRGDIPEDIRSEFERSYEMLKNRWGISLPDHMKEEALDQLLRYLKREDILSHILEAEAEIIVPRKRYIVQGKIDVVLERGGKIEILDYKSGAKPSFADTERWEQYRRQLELYAWLYRESTGREVAKLHLYFLGEKEEDSLFTLDISHEDTEKNLEKFDEIAERILGKEFSEHHISKGCERCELKYYCNIS